jgi:tripartite-type tricarboxylate transporter receptor subunit TctC
MTFGATYRETAMRIVGLTELRHTRALAVAAALTSAIALGCPTVGLAQSYPIGPVKMIVPFPAGGPLDFVARALADKLSANLKQPFVIDNRPGAAGHLGTEAVAKATPDGQTLLVVLDTPLTASPALYKKLPFDPVRDFTPVSALAGFSMMLVVHPSIPANTLSEFVVFAKNRKDQPLVYGSGGASGSPGHLTMEYFRLRAGFEAVHVPYRGNLQVVTDLVGGQVQAGFLAAPGVLSHVREGRLRALAVSSAQRSNAAADVPTMTEAGYPGFTVGFFFVMLAPAGTSESVRAMLEREVQAALKSPDFQVRLRAQDLEALGTTGSEAMARLKATAAVWADVVKAANMTAE